ncbi:G-protein coupled receptor Mth2 [Stylophora pistillata]|uniref:G-protein coupled receptor Mth2 n=1 Tax=Stylophora pistillata TaxID=50429 RepID=A0A2B4RAH8_STYPI|nr:G-protein coupled receptor Mth2 [Stylophora pistillata]
MNLGTSSLKYTVGVVLLSLTFLAARRQEHDNVQGSSSSDGSSNVPILLHSGSKDDFIVRYKAQTLSLRDIFHQQNVSLPERSFFDEVNKQKTSTDQSCTGRCFSKERKPNMTCYCDNACKTFGDCCLDFYSSCNQNSSDVLLQDVECGDINSYLRSGVIMRSTCRSYNSLSTNDCHTLTVQQLNMTLQKELPVFAMKQNVTYRSIACAKCNDEENASFWGLDISCKSTRGSPPTPNLTAVSTFLNEHKDCSWKYAPTHDLADYYRSCVVKDAPCASNKLNISPIVRELCELYSMVFTVDGKRSYRNPHCALCNQEGWLIPQKSSVSIESIHPRLRILLDVSTNIKFTTESRKNSQPTIKTEVLRSQVFNISSQLLNCTATIDNCTCQVLILANNRSSQASLSSNKTLVTLTPTLISYHNDSIRLQGNNVYTLCPTAQPGPIDAFKKYEKELNHITLAGMILSIVSLCLLLIVYSSFKELRNLPGKCVINISGASLCYQAFFLSSKKSTEVPLLCQLVAILLHFFVLSTFSWMAVMALDTACTFTTTASFHCNQNNCDVLLQDVECGDINRYLRSGVIMRSTCRSFNSLSTNDCHTLTVQQLNMTLQKELPVFAMKQNVTYRSIACAKCNDEENASFWGLDISCKSTRGSPPTPNLTAVSTFLNEHKDCSWKYAPTHDLADYYRSCVVKDAPCASNKLNISPIVRELCELYSMVFTVDGKRSYRNPHCALCNQEGWLIPQKSSVSIESFLPPLRILLDVSTNIKFTTESRKNSQPTIKTEVLRSQVFNISSQLLNCTATIDNCTCQVLILANNRSSQASLSSNKTLVTLTPTLISYHNDSIRLQGNNVYTLCPTAQPGPIDAFKKYEKELNHITLAGMILSIVSLCLLLIVYSSFKELRNLPGKCVINISGASLCYQAFFLSSKKSTEVPLLCQLVAILLHFFVLSTFSWMAVMALDTACTFTTTGNLMYCWISDNTALAVFVATPVGASLTFNLICFAKSVCAIRHLQQAANFAATNSSKASLTLICIKLTTVMGLTWILELATNLKQTEFLQYPSAVLNSLQGFFITLCFVTTKRVRGLFKERFSNRRSRAVEPQTNSTHDQRTLGITDVERAEDSTIIATREQVSHNSNKK